MAPHGLCSFCLPRLHPLVVVALPRLVLPDDGLGPLAGEPEGEEVDGGGERRAARDGGAARVMDVVVMGGVR